MTKITADYVGHTKGYDIATVDIVWSGQFAEAGYTVDLTDWIKRDAAEIKSDDIYPSLMASLGGYKGKQIAFPVRRLRQCACLPQGPVRGGRPRSRRRRWRTSSPTR